MKILFYSTIVFFLFLETGFAAELALRSGERVTINANTNTTVTCEGSGSAGNCEDAIEGFKALVRACNSNVVLYACNERHWPKFKANNPSCVGSAIKLCLQYCNSNYTLDYCASWCDK